jgi:replicative DNA helicase
MTPVDHLPPHSAEAEEAVLGSVLIDPESFWRISGSLQSEDFYIVKNQWLWTACLALHARREPVDFVTLAHELEARSQLGEVGGPAYISHLINVVPTAIHAVGYGQIVARCARQRKLLAAASEIAQLAYDETQDDEIVFDRTEQAVLGTRPADHRHDAARIVHILTEYSASVEYLYEHRDRPLGVPTGLIDLDRLLGGLQKSDFDR